MSDNDNRLIEVLRERDVAMDAFDELFEAVCGTTRDDLLLELDDAAALAHATAEARRLRDASQPV
ncbi:MAG: hypothetical protein AAGE01_10390 [Pseudomonadota bacterium]